MAEKETIDLFEFLFQLLFLFLLVLVLALSCSYSFPSGPLERETSFEGTWRMYHDMRHVPCGLTKS